MNTVIYGLHSVQAFLEHHAAQAICLHVAEQKNNDRVAAILKQAKSLGLPVQQSSVDTLNERTDGNHQGVMLEAKAVEPWSDKQLIKEIEKAESAPLILILDTVTDPHNLCLLYTSDAADD